MNSYEKRELVYLKTLGNITNAYRRLLVKKDIHTELGAYPYVPSGVSQLCTSIGSAYKYLKKYRNTFDKLTFLDAGCGPGISLLLAYSIGFNYTIGLEIDPVAVKIARMLNHPDVSRILEADIRTSKVYKEADAIHYWLPMANPKNQRMFEIQVANYMRVGAVIMPCGSDYLFTDHPAFKPEPVFKRLFVKTEDTRIEDFEKYKKIWWTTC